jgi:hypothetical protein
MKAAATSFVNKFAGGRDKVGLITFSGSSYVAFQPNTTFKSTSPNVTTLISQMATGLNTGTAQALSVAYQELTTLNERGAMNVIVLFTDGIPNGLTADYNTVLRVTSSCTYKTIPKVGTIYQSSVFAAQDPGPTIGVMNYLSSSISDVGENRVASGSAGCAYASNSQNMRMDIERMPTADYYGNLTTGYRPVSLTGVDRPTQIVAASVNAADNAARTIRQNANLRPVIYVIGLGGSEPLDQAFMKRVANDVASEVYTETEATGLFVFSPTPAQLETAFERIASEILRLAR